MKIETGLSDNKLSKLVLIEIGLDETVDWDLIKSTIQEHLKSI